MKEKGMKNFVV